MIRVHKTDTMLILEYYGEFSGDESPAKWLDVKLESDNGHIFKNTFHVKKSMVTYEYHYIAPTSAEEDNSRYFVIGKSEGEYYKLEREMLDIENEVFISKELSITEKTFVAQGKISIFKAIDSLISEPVYIGGKHDNAIPKKDFYKLLKIFPTKTEVSHYAHARISGILGEYLGSTTDAQKKLAKYIAKRGTVRATAELSEIKEFELQKYRFIRDRIKEMLLTPEAYTEKDWEGKILEFILVIYPKYIKVLHSIPVKDLYSNPHRATMREIDLGVLDDNGNLDIIEIKKPFDSCILSTCKYRDSYVPKKELSGAVLQAEKYIFHLNKWGIEGEKKLNEKYKGELPDGVKLQIVNPKAMLILGRSKDFDGQQKFDFEIIRRKYANIMDILTYDDLLARLERIIDKFKIKHPEENNDDRIL